MCQLLGVSSNKEVNINLSLKEFKHRGVANPHGWGFAFLENKNWCVIKKHTSLANEYVGVSPFNFRSKTIIGHVRLASCGEKIHKNTHPFNFDNWAFAHNGTLREFKNLILDKYKPIGNTDSEHAFCYLLSEIYQSPANVVEIIKTETVKIKKQGNFNFLLSDGKFLYAHGDNSLFYVQRKTPFGSVTLIDDEYEVNLSEIKSQDECAVVVATKPLTKGEEWVKISGLKIFKDGVLCQV